MKTANEKKTSIQSYLSIIILGLGILVVTYGVIVEDEPTAVGLLLVISGTVWYFVTRYRLRSQTKEIK